MCGPSPSGSTKRTCWRRLSRPWRRSGCICRARVRQPGASVPHLQQVLESLARLTPVPGPPLLPWAIGELTLGNTVILATSEMAGDAERVLTQLEGAGFRTLLLLATLQARPRRLPRGTIAITPECDLAARLEGRE